MYVRIYMFRRTVYRTADGIEPWMFTGFRALRWTIRYTSSLRSGLTTEFSFTVSAHGAQFHIIRACFHIRNTARSTQTTIYTRSICACSQLESLWHACAVLCCAYVWCNVRVYAAFRAYVKVCVWMFVSMFVCICVCRCAWQMRVAHKRESSRKTGAYDLWPNELVKSIPLKGSWYMNERNTDREREKGRERVLRTSEQEHE